MRVDSGREKTIPAASIVFLTNSTRSLVTRAFILWLKSNARFSSSALLEIDALLGVAPFAPPPNDRNCSPVSRGARVKLVPNRRKFTTESASPSQAALVPRGLYFEPMYSRRFPASPLEYRANPREELPQEPPGLV